MLKLKALCACAALVTAPVAIAEELSDTGEFLDGVAAIVNEGVVLKTQLYDQLDVIRKNAAQQGLQLPPADILEEHHGAGEIRFPRGADQALYSVAMVSAICWW